MLLLFGSDGFYWNTKCQKKNVVKLTVSGIFGSLFPAVDIIIPSIENKPNNIEVICPLIKLNASLFELTFVYKLKALDRNMYFTTLPDHSKPGFDEQLHFSKFKKHNIIFNTLSNSGYCDKHIGCLSFKTVLTGEEWYGINNNRLAIRPGQFLVLNDEQTYSCNIAGGEKVRSFSVFFKNEFASSVLQDALINEGGQLDNYALMNSTVPEFFQTLTNFDQELQQHLSRLIASLENFGYEAAMMDEYLVFLLRYLLRVHNKDRRRSNHVQAIKSSTKTELYKRLCIAKDILHSSFMENPGLDFISASACLSVPQLVRQFKAVFHVTPYQYLIHLKLEHAARLLKHTNNPIHSITWMCGFEDTSAFCRAFKSQYGVSPVGFRRQI